MPMNGAVGREEERRVSGLRFALSDKRLSHNGERPAQAAPWGQEPICPAVPSPTPALGSAPPSSPGGGWDKMAQTFEGGTTVPTAACGRKCPALGKGAEDTVWGEARAPHLAASPPTSGLHSTPTPAPGPPAPAQGPEVRGRPPLVVCLEGRGGEGRSPKWAWRRA